ncbi:MAG: putative Fe-S cluster assembly protein SufT [Elusimicrobiota bacterium]|jgi:probable FeS assembly SUF system protein SufT
MQIGESTSLVRDCDVVQIPEGFQVRLARGTNVRLLQALGDTFSVMTEYGTLVRILGKDADAIGMPPPVEGDAVAPTAIPSTAEELKERVWTALRYVYDPEIPINVVELGLIYKNEVTPLASGYKVEVDMTLTAPGCGMGQVLKEDAERRIRILPGVQTVSVQIIFDPPWDQTRMSEAAKLELGLA